MKPVFWISAVAVFLLILFLLFAPTTEEVAVNNSPIADNLTNAEISEEDIDISAKPPLYIGDPEAPATLIEYGDFKCPSCNQFHRNVGKRLRDDYVENGQLNIEFRNFPFIGPDSGRAARGSYCANDQGTFAEYHDGVYDYMWDNYYATGDLASEFENVLTLDVLVEVMQDSAENVDQFRECMESTKYNASVDTDIGLARGDGVTGTPTFVIADQRVTGPSNYNTFKTLIDIELKDRRLRIGE